MKSFPPLFLIGLVCAVSAYAELISITLPDGRIVWVNAPGDSANEAMSDMLEKSDQRRERLFESLRRSAEEATRELERSSKERVAEDRRALERRDRERAKQQEDSAARERAEQLAKQMKDAQDQLKIERIKIEAERQAFEAGQQEAERGQYARKMAQLREEDRRDTERFERTMAELEAKRLAREWREAEENSKAGAAATIPQPNVVQRVWTRLTQIFH